MGWNGKTSLNRAVPPIYPIKLIRRGIGAHLVYSVLFDETGKSRQVDLLYPDDVSGDVGLLDAASRKAIAAWTMEYTFDGAPISCRMRIPMTFRPPESDVASNPNS